MELRLAVTSGVAGLMFLAGAVSVAQAQLCWNCVRPAPVSEPNLWVCEETNVPHEGSTSCTETGYGPCIMGSSCEPMIQSTIENIRPDGELASAGAAPEARAPNGRYADVRGASYARNCSGAVLARSYSPSRVAVLRRQSATIVLALGNSSDKRGRLARNIPAPDRTGRLLD